MSSDYLVKLASRVSEDVKGEPVTWDQEPHYGDRIGVKLSLVTNTPGDEIGWFIGLGAGMFSLRKLAFVLTLSPSHTYQGGRIELGGGFAQVVQEQGAVGTYPAWFMTRVEPVVSGKLSLLLAWSHGSTPFA